MDAAVLGPIGELKAHAVGYATVGLEVFPLNADKTPRTTNGMKDATADPLVVAAWWDAWPDALIGCRIPSDIVVIDVDPKHNGMTTWTLLKKTFGELPTTRSHKSGRNDGGGHLWFERPRGKLSIRALNVWAKDHGTGEVAGKNSWTAGIDLLHHDHRYTILPPSPHPVTGAPYHWVEGRGLNIAVATLPPWLVPFLTEEPEPVKAPPTERAESDSDSIADWFSASHAWHELLEPEDWTLVEGDGDSDGSRWRHPTATQSYSASIRNECLFVFSPNTDFEVTSDGDRHGYTRFAAFAVLRHHGDQSAAARDARRMRAENWDFSGLDPGVFTCPEIHAVEEPEPVRFGQPEDQDWLEWLAFWKGDDEMEQEWLVEPLIPRGRQVALWATHKTGKSLITLEMVAAAATGRSCLGRPARSPIRVVYLDLEMTRADLRERLEDMGYGPESDLENLFYYLLPSLKPLDTPAGGQQLLDIVMHHKADLVVLDTMARVVAGEENSADTYRNFYRCTGRALKALGVSVIRLDHGGKAEGQGQRGSSAKGDDVDIVWQLAATDGGLQFNRKVARMSWIPETVTLVRHTDPVLRHTLVKRAWPAGTEALAEDLDRLGLDLNLSRRKARAALKGTDIQCRNDALGRALQFRKERANNPQDLM